MLKGDPLRSLAWGWGEVVGFAPLAQPSQSSCFVAEASDFFLLRCAMGSRSSDGRYKRRGHDQAWDGNDYEGRGCDSFWEIYQETFVTLIKKG